MKVLEMRVSIKALHYFLSAAEQGSIAKAAGESPRLQEK
jgi:hypothetical protein